MVTTNSPRTGVNTALNSLGFNKNLSQQDVEFFDVVLDTDNEAFVDYNLIKKQALSCPLAGEMANSIDSFMKNLFSYAHFKKNNELSNLLAGLHESNQTSLGFSFQQPKGKAVGNILKETIQGQIQFLMESLKNGNFTPNSFYFGLDNMGPDRTSDVLVSIIKSQLIKFTEDVAIKYSLPTKKFVVDKVYNSNTGGWENRLATLPIHKGRAIFLLPKFLISNKKVGKKAFRSFLSFAFEKYMKNESCYATLISNPQKGLTRKDLREFLKANGIPQKEEFRKHIKRVAGLINEFEISYSEKIDFLSDNELIEIANQAANKLN